MLINGRSAAESTEQILKQLATLPSSFPDYNSNIAPKPIKEEDRKAYNEAVNLYYKGIDLFNKGDNIKALDQLKIAEQTPEVQKDNSFLSYIDTVMARTYQKLNKPDMAVQKFQDSINYSLETKQYYNIENIYKELANLHKEQGTIAQYKREQRNILLASQERGDQEIELKARLALGGIYRVQNNHNEAIEQYSAAYSLQQGKVDYDAVRVEQHEVGFSNQEKIGTDNIQQCVAVILYDPISKKTALAHVDKFTDASSIYKDVLSKFPSNTQLNAYLVGGRDRSAQSLEVSDANIKKVTNELNKYSTINIKSADIGDKGAPSGIVFDPMTAELVHAVPGKEDKTTALRQVALTVALTPRLNFAFDLTESKTIKAPILAQQQQVQVIQQYYYTPQTKPDNTSEVWQSNAILTPFAKAAEDIRQNHPQLVKNILKSIIDYDVNELNIDKDKKKDLKKTLTNRAVESLADKTKPLSAIRSEIKDEIDKNNSNEPLSKSQENISLPNKKTLLERMDDFIDRTRGKIINGFKKFGKRLSKVFKTEQKKEAIPQQPKQINPNTSQIENKAIKPKDNIIQPPLATPVNKTVQQQKNNQELSTRL